MLLWHVTNISIVTSMRYWKNAFSNGIGGWWCYFNFWGLLLVYFICIFACCAHDFCMWFLAKIIHFVKSCYKSCAPISWNFYGINSLRGYSKIKMATMFKLTLCCVKTDVSFAVAKKRAIQFEVYIASHSHTCRSRDK